MLAPILRPTQTAQTDFDFEKYAKFKAHSVIIQKRWRRYSYDENGNRTIVIPDLSQKNAVSLSNLEKGAAGQWNGYMSPATRRKVKGIVENYLTAVQLNTSMAFPKSFPSMEVYPAFLTLTLPAKQIHCDNDIKRECFLRFIEWLTTSKDRSGSGWNVKNYIWVAETQKNGNIHFHMIIDRALPADAINRKWNQFLERLGYVTRFRNCQNYIYSRGWYVRQDMLKERVNQKQKACRATSQAFNKHDVVNAEKKRQHAAYNKGVAENWNNPPSTKIHAIHNIKKLTAYVSKYMTKAPEVNIKLHEGETLTEENGKYFIESETIERQTSIEGQDLETIHHHRKEVKVNFRNRYIRGRVWGASKLLHADNVSPYTVALETISAVTTTTYDYRTVKIRKAIHTTDLWGNQVFSHMAEVVQENVVRDSSMNFESPVVDYDAARYVQFLTEAHVPKKDIDMATARAGDHFRHSGGVIVPLQFPQKDILRAYSPAMYDRYAEYYRDMFNTLYPAENA